MGVKHISTNSYFDHEFYEYEPIVEEIVPEVVEEVVEVAQEVVEVETPMKKIFRRLYDITRSYVEK
jgi:hypothetical protein